MYACIYVYVYIVHTCMCVHACLYVCIYVYTCIMHILYVCMHIYVCIMYICIHICIYTCMRACMYCVCMYEYRYVCRSRGHLVTGPHLLPYLRQGLLAVESSRLAGSKASKDSPSLSPSPSQECQGCRCMVLCFTHSKPYVLQWL